MKVQFVKDFDQTNNDHNTIYIRPSKDTWNDYGHRAHCYATIPDGGVSLEIKIVLGFSNDGTLYSNYHSELKKTDVWFTLCSDISSYKKVVTKFGSTRAQEIFSVLNELSYIEGFEKEKRLIEVRKFMGLSVFAEAFLREEDRYSALINGRFIINGCKFDHDTQLPSEISCSYEVVNHEVDITLSIEDKRKSIISNNNYVIIGENGVGKSRALHSIVKKYSQLECFSQIIHMTSDSMEDFIDWKKSRKRSVNDRC